MENNLNKGSFFTKVIIVVILILIILGGIYLYSNKKVDAPTVDEKGQIDTLLADKNKKTFKLGVLEFSYPDFLSYGAQGGVPVINLTHSVSFKHVNSCDLKDGSSLNDATDFGISFKLYNSDLNNSIKKDNPNMLEFIFKGNTIITEEGGFVDKYKIGVLDGYKISVGVEGCGYTTYYFPISANETLVVRRDIYLQTLQMDREKLINIPGFISSTQEEQIFEDILSSVKGLPNQEMMSVKVYFGNTIDVQSCHTPSYVERIIPKTTAVAQAAINELLNGPTESEKKQDRWTGLRNGISIKSISIKNEVVYLDLYNSSALSLNDPNRGACGASLAMKQIENTLKQFPTIKSTVITLNGQSAENSIDP